MSPDAAIGPLSAVLDRIIPDARARDAAKLELLKLQGTPDLDALRGRLDATAVARPTDPWTSRARPTFLYVMYVMILWAIPMGLIAAFEPRVAASVVGGMTAYLKGIPDSLWALFGTGYLGYTAARSLGKARGIEK